MCLTGFGCSWDKMSPCSPPAPACVVAPEQLPAAVLRAGNDRCTRNSPAESPVVPRPGKLTLSGPFSFYAVFPAGGSRWRGRDALDDCLRRSLRTRLVRTAYGHVRSTVHDVRGNLGALR